MEWDSDEHRNSVPEPSSSYANRRRSVAQSRPAVPPPNLPIPSIPQPDLENMYNSYHDLSDPPPQSILPTASRIHDPPQPSRPTSSQLLAPPSDQPIHKPPSSRRALTRALELARQAVQLDSTNDNPELAVQAYGKSVALLSEVMERVRRGEDSTEIGGRRRNGRRRSVVAQEEEHDTYADRMNILSIIYSIPPMPYTSSSIYSAAFNSNELAQAAAGAEESDTYPSANHTPNNEPTQSYSDHPYGHDRPDDGVAAIGTAMFFDDLPSPARSDILGLPPQSSSHPYATAQYDSIVSEPSSSLVAPIPTQLPIAIPANNLSSPGNRNALASRRSRALSSGIPPALPPPAVSPPPAPIATAYEPEPTPSRHLEVSNRPRGDSSVGHRRTGSGSRLGILEEEERAEDSYSEELLRQPISHHQESSRYQSPSKRDNSRMTQFESPPLPPVPSPTSSDTPGTPRTPSQTSAKPSASPRVANARPRNTSSVSARSDGSLNIINTTTNQGTISQRRLTKSSAPPTPRSSSPAESTASAGSLPPIPRGVPSSLPGASTVSLPSSGGRSRSSSQPGRRPSIINGHNGHNTPNEQLPPLPTNGITQRKTSYTGNSKLNPNAQQPTPLTVQTDIPNVNGLQSAFGFSIVATGMPITPTSPLPPAAPTDPLRKPYHLMNLLRTTMMSNTGGYITRRLHVPQEVWSQGGAKLGNLIEKVRVIGILCQALEDLQEFSSEYFGAGNVSSGLALGIGSIGRREGEMWVSKLEEFSLVCEGVVADFGKKLGVGEGFAVKKTTWSDKLGRRFDKFTNGKNLDSPAGYVQGLKKLFLHAQLLDEHTKAVTAQPVAPSYSGLPPDIRSAADMKLKRASEFFASVVLTFVIRDLSQLLDKYAKKCEKWLAE
ncbi:hypothetical protein Moror_154 [Moniliophthora roreri MCA 2997]|uniref:MIT domain-containing protein n=1 Tax=Moniliophthora roreri (strain MCA 2997) TaxID=1381753 RepID=V2Z356_MONRO|nr:hypothetical protein Moror_154 [Moniliophthora roreri MCA 2997]